MQAPSLYESSLGPGTTKVASYPPGETRPRVARNVRRNKGHENRPKIFGFDLCNGNFAAGWRLQRFAWGKRRPWTDGRPIFDRRDSYRAFGHGARATGEW